MADLTYEELLAQRESLESKLKEARDREVAKAVIEINERMDKLGMTVADLSRGKAPLPPGAPHRLPPKYRNPKTGETWAGRGHQPPWFKEAIAAGTTADELRVKS